MSRIRDAQRGFTLIEMMIVVAIIAILVALLAPNFIHARAQAQTTACEANLKEIATALELYQTDHDAYPQVSGQKIDGSASDPLTPYLRQVPVDPAAGPGAYYTYSVQSDASGVSGYTIVCPGRHDPSTLQTLSPGTSNTHLRYDSSGGFSAVSGQ